MFTGTCRRTLLGKGRYASSLAELHFRQFQQFFSIARMRTIQVGCLIDGHRFCVEQSSIRPGDFRRRVVRERGNESMKKRRHRQRKQIRQAAQELLRDSQFQRF
jgi:hypothetical protein